MEYAVHTICFDCGSPLIVSSGVITDERAEKIVRCLMCENVIVWDEKQVIVEPMLLKLPVRLNSANKNAC
jgi:hypothetical protein